MTPQLSPVYRGEQIRAAEKPLLDAGKGEQLMRRAAHGLAHRVLQILEQTGGVYGARVTGLIGPGNNGGDGLWALAFLRRRGVDAHAVLLREKAHPAGLEAFRRAGGRTAEDIPAGTSVLIDAILGTGFKGAFTRPEVPGLQQAVSAAVVVACDLPSGVDADTGAAAADVIPADHTVTFGGLKQGLLAGAGGRLSGTVHTVDIGLGPQLPKTPVHAAEPAQPGTGPAPGAEPENPAAPAMLPAVRGPQAADHKYSRGTLGILAGSEQFPGAALLTASAACATGCGMVSLYAPAEVNRLVLQRRPEVVPGTAPATAPEAGKAPAAVVIGPGLGQDPQRMAEAEAALEHALQESVPCVLDASGLQLVRTQLRRRGGLNKNVLITPHAGEARRLAQDLRDPVLTKQLTPGAGEDPVEAARRLAGALDCSVLLKGATTIIASPQGEVILHRAQTPGLATAGTGDVLSGILGALAATQPKDWSAVAVHAVDLHRRAAVRIDPHGRGRFGASALIAALGS